MARRLGILMFFILSLALLVSAGDLAGPRPEALRVLRATDLKGPAVPAPTLPMPQPNFNGGYHVLIACADDGPGPLPALLPSYPDISVVDVMDIRSSGPTLSTLLTYDVVITWSNYVYYNATGWGDLLADYVDAGGRVILAMFAIDSELGAPWPDDLRRILPIDPGQLLLLLRQPGRLRARASRDAGRHRGV